MGGAAKQSEADVREKAKAQHAKEQLDLLRLALDLQAEKLKDAQARADAEQDRKGDKCVAKVLALLDFYNIQCKTCVHYSDHMHVLRILRTEIDLSDVGLARCSAADALASAAAFYKDTTKKNNCLLVRAQVDQVIERTTMATRGKEIGALDVEIPPDVKPTPEIRGDTLRQMLSTK